MVFTFRSILLVLVAGLARADEFSPPTSYYGPAVGLTGTSLDTALRTIVGAHSVRTYDQLRQDLALTDRDWNFPPSTPSAVTNILLIYSNGWSGESRSGVWDSGVTWNREHVWPDSRGIGQPDSGPDFSDLHHLRAANPSVNSSRSNSYFDMGGNIAPVIQSPLAHATSSTWEPPDIDKGWVARACLYMATRYDGTEPNTLNLELVESPPLSTITNPPQMGRKSTLLLWNRKHPPSQWERRRNQIIYDQFQHNRNPFIDHPEFADVIYEQPAGVETLMTWKYRHFSLDELSAETVSGDAADPDGDGKSNLLEFALAGNPRGSGVSDEPVLSKSSTPGYLVFTYRRQRDRLLSGVTYSVETSADLTQWQLANGVESSVTIAGSTELATVVLVDQGSPMLFARLKVSRLP